MIRFFLTLVFAIAFASASQAQQQPAESAQQVTDEDVEERIGELESPLYNPFVERYLLDEVKALRQEMQNTRA
ncbi:MAG: hypothetical protein LPK24_12975, partial [Marinobacter sp.]|nr:hypothetical protein [Marinobacter sp.]MDX5472791.1 hypothetical protein [Marinobacter sp.]